MWLEWMWEPQGSGPGGKSSEWKDLVCREPCWEAGAGWTPTPTLQTLPW